MLMTTLLTPFHSSGSIDLARLRAHVLWLTAKGMQGFVVGGPASEAPFLSLQEFKRIIATVCDATNDASVHVVALAATPIATASLIATAIDCGATGVVVPPPMLYALDAHGLEAWYRAIHSVSPGPGFYALDDPRHFQCSLEQPLLARLLQDGVIRGLVDASGDPHRLRRRVRAHPGAVIAGNDTTLPDAATLPELVASTTRLGNAWPTLCASIHGGRARERVGAFRTRLRAVERAGGIRALKAVLDMPCRLPLVAVEPDRIAGLPARER